MRLLQGSSDQDEDDLEKDIVTERFIVDKTSLQKLFHFCSVENCGSIIDPSDVTFHKVGVAVIVKSTCLKITLSPGRLRILWERATTICSSSTSC